MQTKRKPRTGRFALFLGLLVLAAFLTASFLTWARISERRRYLHSNVTSLAAQYLGQYLEERADDLRYIALQWGEGGPRGRGSVLKALQAIYNNHPEYHCLKLLDPQGIVLGGVSLSAQGVGIGTLGWEGKGRREVFLRARANPGTLQLSNPVTLRTGVPGVLIVRTVGWGGASQGFVYEAMSLQTLLGLLEGKPWSRDYVPHLILTEHRQPTGDAFHLNEVNVLGRTLHLEMVPKSGVQDESSFAPPLILGLSGLVLAFLVSFLAWRVEREEARVRDIGRRFQTALENSYDIIWTALPGKGFIFVSPSFNKLLGYGEKDIAGRMVESYAVEEDRHIVREGLERLRKGETLRQIFVRFRAADGRIFHLEGTASPVFDEKGNLTLIEGAARDVTESRRMEDRFRRLIETSSDLVLEADAEGRVLFINGAVQSILGLEPSQVEGRPLWDFIHADARPRLRTEVRNKLLQSGSTEFEARFTHADGSDRFLNFRLKRENAPSPEPAGFHAIGRDVTEQHLMANQIQQFQKMEAIGKLAGGMAHDFNNLLTVILSHAEGASQDLDGGVPAQKDLQQIQKAARRAAELTRQVLTFSRRYPVEPVEMNLNAVVLEMEEFLKQLLPAGVSLEVEAADDLGWVMADRSQMEQVVMNLVLNAKDAMPQGGAVRLVTRNTELTEPLTQGPNYLAAGKWVVLEVRDAGKGIPPENVEHIFEPFYTTKMVGQGTGLGLSVVYGIVRAHQGGLHVETETGQGTTVRVFLPPVSTASHATPKPESGAPEALLLVEPDDFNRKVLWRLLDLMGYPVTTAVDASEALLLGAENPRKFRLLLASLRDGVEAAEKLHSELRKTQGDPGLILLDPAPLGSKGDEGGNVLRPPYDTERLSGMIRTALDRKPRT